MAKDFNDALRAGGKNVRAAADASWANDDPLAALGKLAGAKSKLGSGGDAYSGQLGPDPPPYTGAEPPPSVDGLPLTIDEWFDRNLPEPDRLLGEWFTTTSRVLISAPTGIGKTNFGMQLFGHMADGRDFLHWRGHRKAKVAYIDGEMSRRLFRRRIIDLANRLSSKPKGLLLLSREDVENFQPLNTPAGKTFIEAFIAKHGVDAICFDNVMSLLLGSMKEEEAWANTMPLVESLTRQSIGQVWIDHTGRDENRSYGTKTKEWRMDTVMHLTEVKRPDTDVSFTIEFRKARERTPETRRDFETVTIALVDDVWVSDGEAPAHQEKQKLSSRQQLALDALVEVTLSSGQEPPAEYQLPAGIKVVAMKAWETELERRSIIESKNPRARFGELRNSLATRKLITVRDKLVWDASSNQKL